MAKAEQLPDIAEARPKGNRAYMRRKLSPMAYVELGQDNGGILLNLSEGGFAVQSALALTSREFAELRFQVPAFQGWLTASGRIVWVSQSKKEAGIQFTELPAAARREIHNWVSAEEGPETVKERIPPVRPTLSSARRAQGETRHEVPGGTNSAAAIARERKTAADASIHAPQRETQSIAPPGRQAVSTVVAEPSPQEFHFTDYSMFAAEPESDAVWQQQPVRRRWPRVVVGVLVAAIFFTLGATIGRGTVDQWIAYLGRWTQSEVGTGPARKAAPPAVSNSAEGAAESKAQGKQESNRINGEDRARAEGDGSMTSGSAASSIDDKLANEAKSEVGASTPTPKDKAANGGTGRDLGATVPGANELRTRHPAEGVLSRSGHGMDVEPGKTEGEHAILVNAPEAGSRPFLVSLPGEAVSASPAIAISARRTLEIPPRSSTAANGSQRVVIGKLIVHGEPFYPAEARKRGVEGSVEVRARIGRTGEVIGVTPVSGPWLLFPAAVNAVREWRYEPTFINGDPAETAAEITIVFRLQ